MELNEKNIFKKLCILIVNNIDNFPSFSVEWRKLMFYKKLTYAYLIIIKAK